MEARTAVFVDASGWIGLLNQRDQHHRRALALWAGLGETGAGLVTSSLMVAEAHAVLLSRLGHEPARRFLQTVLEGEVGEIVWVDAELARAAAVGWVYRRPDRAFSLADATSFEIMAQRDLAYAFTFDHDFVRAGFRLLR